MSEAGIPDQLAPSTQPGPIDANTRLAALLLIAGGILALVVGILNSVAVGILDIEPLGYFRGLDPRQGDWLSFESNGFNLSHSNMLYPVLAILFGCYLFRRVADRRILVVLSWVAAIIVMPFWAVFLFLLQNLALLLLASHRLTLTLAPWFFVQAVPIVLYAVGFPLLAILLHQPGVLMAESVTGPRWTLFIPKRRFLWIVLGTLLFFALSSAPYWNGNPYNRMVDGVLSSSEVADQVGRPQEMKLERIGGWTNWSPYSEWTIRGEAGERCYLIVAWPEKSAQIVERGW